jgi:hypothetical protein
MSLQTARAKPAAGFAMEHPYWAGALLGLASIPVFVMLPEDVSRQWGALLLAIIAGAYLGFASIDGRFSANVIELIGALGFGVVALAGLLFNPLLIAGGYVAHGFWDLFHHNHGPYADTPHWFIPYCVVYDWILGAFLFVWWL